ncbi:XRE family transcriptional regulator [Roseovarius pacificus]|uniref:helix-turn-helix domain-containing protein n=1 Tax=Roseovarius pacificus TaxID=337701 RepID=UPI00259A1ABF|nr:XRE family transcriptional regulator [Roseovarius pacificus]MDW3118520.1 XRE family transcriptional regulator [Roseovarius pacificus]
MQQTDITRPRTLGADLRALRKARGLTLNAMAERLNRSVGWLSQVERDMSDPSITDLRHMAAVLDVPVSMLFGQPSGPVDEAGHVVRQGARRRIGSGAAGLIEELLSPDLTDDFEMVHCTFEPHSRIGEVVTRPTQEVGYLISGKLDLIIAERRFTLHPGDSFRVRAEPFEWINPYDAPAVAIWVIAPPVY